MIEGISRFYFKMSVKRKIFLKRVVGCNSKGRNIARRTIKMTMLGLSIWSWV